MLRTACPNISVITNFGCSCNCWYCIWKGHELEHVKQETDWEKLEQFLSYNKYKCKVSISGGGDCLYNFLNNIGWWYHLFGITSKFNMLVDVHTREKLTLKCFWNDINRCVFSSDNLEEDKEYFKHLIEFTKLRIVHVVTANTTFEMIEEYLKFQQLTSCQFTIKKLIKYDDKGMYAKIKNKYPDIYSLDEGDYNIYYMPDNSIRTSFL